MKIADFNSPIINSESLSSNNEDSQLLTFYNDNFLIQFVNEPTREHNILDLILVYEENIISDVVIDSPLSTSDHNMVQVKIDVEGNIKFQVLSRLNYKLARWNILKERLANHSVNINKYGHEYWNNFKYNLLISQEECIPRKYIKNGQPDARWFCHDHTNKDKLYKKWKRLPFEKLRQTL